MRKLIVTAIMALPGLCFALDLPESGADDPRVRFVKYNSTDVVRIVGHYGFQTHIVLQPGESVVKSGVAMGDSEAWSFGTNANNIFLKPKLEKALTNLTVLTNKRAYTFELNAHWSKKKANSDDMYFKVIFAYPEDEARVNQKTQSAEQLAKLLEKKEEPANYNYWVQGSDYFTPTKASDDGRFTRLTFAAGREIPAIYIEDLDNEGKPQESLVNTHVEGDTVVIHKVVKKLVLRKGSYVTCIFNESYTPDGLGNTTGTSSPDVVREVAK